MQRIKYKQCLEEKPTRKAKEQRVIVKPKVNETKVVVKTKDKEITVVKKETPKNVVLDEIDYEKVEQNRIDEKTLTKVPLTTETLLRLETNFVKPPSPLQVYLTLIFIIIGVVLLLFLLAYLLKKFCGKK